MIEISIFKKKYLIYKIYNLIFIIEWLHLHSKYLILTLAIYTALAFFTFVILDIYLSLNPNISEENKLIITRVLKLMEISSLITMLSIFLLIYILSVLEYMHEILTTLLFSEFLQLLIIDLQVISFKFLVKTWMWIFVYTKVYKFFTKVFFEFKGPLDKFGNFLLKIFPIITKFIVYIMFSLMCCAIVDPNSIFYL